MTEEERFNRQVNYIIINIFWKHTHHGERIETLYRKLNMQRNSYGRVMSGDPYNTPNLERKWQSRTNKDVGLYVLGLSKACMLGKERIEIDGIGRAEWEDYLSYRYGGPNTEEEEKEKKKFETKLKKSFDRLMVEGVRQTSKRPIDLLLYYMKHDRANTEEAAKDWEIKELKRILGMLKAAHWKECENGLLKASIRELEHQLRMAKTVAEYRELES